MKLDTEITPPGGAGRTMPRRDFLRALGALVAAAAVGRSLVFTSPVVAQSELSSVFPDGIKSGDPKPRSSMIWTRVAANDSEPVSVLWSVAEDEYMQNVVRGGYAMWMHPLRTICM